MTYKEMIDSLAQIVSEGNYTEIYIRNNGSEIKEFKVTGNYKTYDEVNKHF